MIETVFNALAGLVDHIFSNPWYLVGFAGQFFFMMRFVVQWVYSERQRRSIIPVAFWFFSIGGGSVLLVYAISQADPVFIAGQSLGLLIYARNLWFIFGRRRQELPRPDSERMIRLTERLEREVKQARDPRDNLEAIEATLAELQASIEGVRDGAAADKAPPPRSI